MPVKEGGLLAAVVVRVPAGPRADDPLDEVAHGEEQQQYQDARQLPRKPAYVVEEYVDGELAAAHRRAGTTIPGEIGRAAPLAIAALALPAEGLTSGEQTCREKGASGPACCPAAAQRTGDHFWMSQDGNKCASRLPCVRCCTVKFRDVTGLSFFPAVH